MKHILIDAGIEVSDEQYEMLTKHVDLFKEWNSKINLSAIRQDEDIWKKHMADSLLVLKHINLNGSRILDLGAGGGFPSLPLSIMVPSSSFNALDSVGKKMKAVQDMADNLGVRLKTVNGRAEKFGQDPLYREQYNVVLTRAFAPWPTLLELALPFVEPGGMLIAYQGPAIMDDLNTYADLPEKLGGELGEIYTDTLYGAERCFVCVEKVSPTKQKYPRPDGEPKHNPLT